MRTYSATPSEVEHKWYLIDADGAVLGDEQFSFARNVLHQRSRHDRTVGVDVNPAKPLVALLCLGGHRLEQEKKRHARV